MLCAPTNVGAGTGGGTAHRRRPLVRQGGPVLFSSPFVGDAGTGPAFPADPHPAGAAVSRPRAHAMRPYKYRGDWRRHGTPAPPTYPAGRPRPISPLSVGNAGTAPPFSSDPHPVGAAVSRPRAHAMRPYKRGGGDWRRHGTSVPPLSIPQNTAHHVSQRGAPYFKCACFIPPAWP